jgi:hypothetical protein
MAESMTHHCPICGRRFALTETPTLDELQINRILVSVGGYYHTPCAKLKIWPGTRRVYGIVDEVAGRLVEYRGA